MITVATGQRAPAGGASTWRCVLLLAAALASALAGSACRRSTIPDSLSDADFWTLIETLSEPPGVFTQSENFVSNEPHYAESVRRLRPSGGAYIGVGPEQNFSYIASLRPDIAFIVDIRRENLALHLFYKALFELSRDRVEFASRLFSRPPPEGLRANASVDEIFDRFDMASPSQELYDRTRALVQDRLLKTHGFPLTDTDLAWIDRVSHAFRAAGPRIDYYGSRDLDAVRPSYRDLMIARDLNGQARSYLGTARAFQFVKDLQSRNLIVPVVGDFGGPHAIRRVGEYVRAHHGDVTAVYASNVAIYLTNQQTKVFCYNLSTLPAPRRASFVESNVVRWMEARLRACVPQTPQPAQ